MSDYTGYTPVEADPEIEADPTVGEIPGADADDDFDYHPAPAITITGAFVGGDPTEVRVRDVSVRVDIRAEDHISDFGHLIAVTLAELAKLGRLATYETTLQVDGQTMRVENGSGGTA